MGWGSAWSRRRRRGQRRVESPTALTLFFTCSLLLSTFLSLPHLSFLALSFSTLLSLYPFLPRLRLRLSIVILLSSPLSTFPPPPFLRIRRHKVGGRGPAGVPWQPLPFVSPGAQVRVSRQSSTGKNSRRLGYKCCPSTRADVFTTLACGAGE